MDGWYRRQTHLPNRASAAALASTDENNGVALSLIAKCAAREKGARRQQASALAKELTSQLGASFVIWCRRSTWPCTD